MKKIKEVLHIEKRPTKVMHTGASHPPAKKESISVMCKSLLNITPEPSEPSPAERSDSPIPWHRDGTGAEDSDSSKLNERVRGSVIKGPSTKRAEEIEGRTGELIASSLTESSVRKGTEEGNGSGRLGARRRGSGWRLLCCPDRREREREREGSESLKERIEVCSEDSLVFVGMRESSVNSPLARSNSVKSSCRSTRLGRTMTGDPMKDLIAKGLKAAFDKPQSDSKTGSVPMAIPRAVDSKVSSAENRLMVTGRQSQVSFSMDLIPDEAISVLELPSPSLQNIHYRIGFNLGSTTNRESLDSSLSLSHTSLVPKSLLDEKVDMPPNSLESKVSVSDSLLSSTYFPPSKPTPPLTIDSSYFTKDRKFLCARSPPLTPHPSLESSATTSEFGFSPLMPTIHPGMMQRRSSSPFSSEHWSNVSHSLFGSTPTVHIRGGGSSERIHRILVRAFPPGKWSQQRCC